MSGGSGQARYVSRSAASITVGDHSGLLIVEIDKAVIALRGDFQNDSADFPQDSDWRRATLVFSDGHRQTVDLANKAEPQAFTFDVRVRQPCLLEIRNQKDEIRNKSEIQGTEIPDSGR